MGDDVFRRLVNEFSKMPNVGSKTAEKMAYYVLGLSDADSRRLAELIVSLRKEVHFCSMCGSMTDEDPCRICTSPIRRKSLLCVVKDARDIVAIERIHSYDGLYHSLGGLISPIDGVRPSDLRIEELMGRVAAGGIKEVVLAISPSAEGETTAIYITKRLKPYNIKITRIARGIPAGGELEYADDVTLANAMMNRQEC